MSLLLAVYVLLPQADYCPTETSGPQSLLRTETATLSK